MDGGRVDAFDDDAPRTNRSRSMRSYTDAGDDAHEVTNVAKGRVLNRMEEYVDVERREDGEDASALEVR